MSTITITLEQKSETAVMTRIGDIAVSVDRPIANDGGGDGLVGGQYMLIGIGGCFCSTLFAAARGRDIHIEGLRMNVSAQLSDNAPERFTDIKLNVSYTRTSHPEEMEKLMKVAENGCISVNTVKNGVTLQTILNN